MLWKNPFRFTETGLDRKTIWWWNTPSELQPMYLGATLLVHMRLSLYLITALIQSDNSHIHMHREHARPFANTSQSIFIPTPMSCTHVSPTLQVCKVDIRDEQDRLSIQIHEGLEDGDVSTFVWGKHGHFNIRNCGDKDQDRGYWRPWWGPTSFKRYIHCWTRVRVKVKSSCGKGDWTLVIYRSAEGLGPEDLFHRVVKAFSTSPTKWLSFV